MEEYVIYQQWTRDSTNPRYLFAIPKHELAAKLRDPLHHPHAYALPNQRRLEQDVKKTREEQGEREYHVEELPRYASADHIAVRIKATDYGLGALRQEIGEERYDDLIRNGRPTATLQESKTPPSYWAKSRRAAKPKPQAPPISKVSTARPPAKAELLARRADLALQFIRDKTAKDAKLAASSNGGQHIGRYPPPEQQPIPQAVWHLIQDIKALPKSPVTGFPKRSALCTLFFKQDFDSNTGFLKEESALYRYRGDQKMLSEHWWQFILPPPGLREVEGGR